MNDHYTNSGSAETGCGYMLVGGTISTLFLYTLVLFLAGWRGVVTLFLVSVILAGMIVILVERGSDD